MSLRFRGNCLRRHTKGNELLHSMPWQYYKNVVFQQILPFQSPQRYSSSPKRQPVEVDLSDRSPWTADHFESIYTPHSQPPVHLSKPLNLQISCSSHSPLCLSPVSCIPYPVSRIPYPVSCIPYPVSRIPYPVSCILYPVLALGVVGWCVSGERHQDGFTAV